MSRHHVMKWLKKLAPEEETHHCSLKELKYTEEFQMVCFI